MCIDELEVRVSVWTSRRSGCLFGRPEGQGVSIERVKVRRSQPKARVSISIDELMARVSV